MVFAGRQDQLLIDYNDADDNEDDNYDGDNNEDNDNNDVDNDDLDQAELRSWMMPEEYDQHQAEASHLIHEADRWLFVFLFCLCHCV